MTVGSSPCRPDLLSDLLDESLSPDQTAALTAHVDTCVDCRKQLEGLAAAPHVWRETRLVLSDPALRQSSQHLRTRWLSAQDLSANDLASRPTGPGSLQHSSPRSAAVAYEEGDPPESAPNDGAIAREDPHAQRRRLHSLLPMLDQSDQASSLGRLDDYEIRQIVGWGGMGVVLHAFDPTLGRAVAIKVLHPHLAAHGAARKRFAREARAAAAVNHPSVVPIHSVNADHEPPYIVMAYVPGGSLQDRLDREGPLQITDLLQIGIQIADALAAAHAQGLVHRDVKPGNILLDHGQNRVLLTDFGLAQALDDATLTASGAIAGTPQYMSPEQARGQSVDPRSDLFSLGGVLYAMVTGHPPFRAESTLAVLQRIGHGRPRPLSEAAPEAPEWLSRTLEYLQASEPQDRPQSAAEVANLLRECLAHARRPQENALPVGLPPTKPPKKPPTRSNAHAGSSLSHELRPPWWVLAIAFLILVVGISLGPLRSMIEGPAEATLKPAPLDRQITNEDRLPNLTWGGGQFQSSPRYAPLPVDPTRWDDGLDLPLNELKQTLQQLD